MFYFSMDFRELMIDDQIDAGALTSVISDADLNKTKVLSNCFIIDTGPAPNFLKMVASGQPENPIDTVNQRFEVADFEFREHLIRMETFRHPLVALCFIQ